ncbi:MAG: PorV/PorQ family protein [Candidatus Coatesbacteria bacterium]|nr:PorV/PorQ family protein [Candidatus Coatesbacteria bacterium]
MKHKTLALLLVLVLVLPAMAQEKTGIATAQFLKIGVGPRMLGMGGAVVATGMPEAAMAFWNPAATARIPGFDLFFEDNEWVAETRMLSGALAYNLKNVGTFGATFQYLDYGEMTRTDQDHQDGNGTFTAYDMAAGLTYGRNLTDRFAVGGRAQWIHMDIDGYTADGWAVDVGTLYNTGFQSLRIGMALQYFGGDIAFDGTYGELLRDKSGYTDTEFTANVLPMTFRLGVAYDLLEGDDHFMTVGLDAIHPNDAEERVNVGVEYKLYRIAAIRAGYQVNYDFFVGEDEDADSFAPGLNAGVGFNIPAGGMNIKADAAYADMGRLGYSLRFSLGFAF